MTFSYMVKLLKLIISRGSLQVTLHLSVMYVLLVDFCKHHGQFMLSLREMHPLLMSNSCRCGTQWGSFRFAGIHKKFHTSSITIQLLELPKLLCMTIIYLYCSIQVMLNILSNLMTETLLQLRQLLIPYP